jgi:electron transport complex protein RnfD
MASTDRFAISAPPHLRSKAKISNAMRDVLIALIPVVGVAIYFFRWDAVINIAVCVATAALTEVVARSIARKKITLYDYSAVVTGLFLALLLPPATSWWAGVIGTVIAVGIAKELLGGLGRNIFNPALFGRVSLIFLSTWYVWIGGGGFKGTIDGVVGSTPLFYLKEGALGAKPSYAALFLANPGGSLSEVSVLAVLIGAAYLFYRRVISWEIPTSIILSAFVLSAILGVDPLYTILAGGLMFGAFFMATDWVTSPVSRNGQLIFGACIGILVVLIRQFTVAPEGVAYAILITNAFVPLLDRVFKPKAFGTVAAAQKAA